MQRRDGRSSSSDNCARLAKEFTGVSAPAIGGQRNPEILATPKNFSARFLAVFGLWRPSPSPGTVKQRFRTKNRPQRSCRDIQVPTLRKNCSVGGEGTEHPGFQKIGPAFFCSSAVQASAGRLSGPPGPARERPGMTSRSWGTGREVRAPRIENIELSEVREYKLRGSSRTSWVGARPPSPHPWWSLQRRLRRAPQGVRGGVSSADPRDPRGHPKACACAVLVIT